MGTSLDTDHLHRPHLSMNLIHKNSRKASSTKTSQSVYFTVTIRLLGQPTFRHVGTAMSKKVVFFFPSFASSEATAPLGILAVATPLLRAGYQVVLIDSTITPNFKQRVLHEVRDAVCLGVSLVTGPMIRETVEIARAIKERQPEFPIILGGWHPSLLPTQTLEAP